MKPIHTILLMSLCGVLFTSGCATARGGDRDTELTASLNASLNPKVTLSVVSFDPSVEFTYTFADGTRALMQGKAVLRIEVSPPGYGFEIQQSPVLDQYWTPTEALAPNADESTWTTTPPLYLRRLTVSDTSEVWEGVYQILSNPDTGDMSKQFWRAVY